MDAEKLVSLAQVEQYPELTRTGDCVSIGSISFDIEIGLGKSQLK
ncbi:hypothetical protein CAter282_4633 [Collimonas arenae]|uniref:Uncharacterized protein n=1 Tax=Collimonas arenae TaxID=279058 RepID=A0A127PYD8_9BURK|nr:hypothetical protein CAter10_5038 [Collimonas arenae]AMP12288.1 hypothetical protein CAter282_4633 [Collimonas arenae]